MKSFSQMGRLGAVLVIGLATCEVLIMISPFAGFFYASVHFEPLLGFLSSSSITAWLDGFFLNHSVVTSSKLLEGQRILGGYIFALGLWGFFISAFQVYGKKILGRGVATGLLYRIWRHPQYVCLGIAGWGLLTIWPRFLLLGLWVTMIYLYIALARFEEHRMEERFGDAYRRYVETHQASLPARTTRRLFEATLGRIRPRPLGWIAAYGVTLVLVFSLGFALRSYTRSSTVTVRRPELAAGIISAWPQSKAWAASVFDTALTREDVRQQVENQKGHPIVATILPPRYAMKSMFYILPPEKSPASSSQSSSTAGRMARIALRFLFPWLRSPEFMGVDPDSSDSPVQVVFSRAEKPYKDDLSLDEVFDPSVRLTPLLVVEVKPTAAQIAGVKVPLPQNRWGPKVVMPLF